MSVLFQNNAQEDYLYWQSHDRDILNRINAMIKVARITPFEGIGKPKSLGRDYPGYWSRRIDRKHRLVYTVREGDLIIVACRFHRDESFSKSARSIIPSGKNQITIRLDSDVLAWQKNQGKGYQSRINAILRSHYEASQEVR